MESLNVRDWIEIGKGGATLVVALIAAYIAARQVQTARNKLKADLFDRRMAVYKVLNHNITIVHVMRTIDEKQYYAINGASVEAQWIFSSQFHDVALEAANYALFAFTAAEKQRAGAITPQDERVRDIAFDKMESLLLRLQALAKSDLKLEH